MAKKETERLAVVEARHGEKMIEIKVRFWTDGIEEKDRIRPRHAWSSGVVRIERNKAHSITPGHPRPFNSLPEIGVAIEKVLMEHGIILYHSRKMRKYMAEPPLKPSSTS
jgi:hypothetical protein